MSKNKSIFLASNCLELKTGKQSREASNKICISCIHALLDNVGKNTDALLYFAIENHDGYFFSEFIFFNTFLVKEALKYLTIFHPRPKPPN